MSQETTRAEVAALLVKAAVLRRHILELQCQLLAVLSRAPRQRPVRDSHTMANTIAT
jgi:hypothetical protein